MKTNLKKFFTKEICIKMIVSAGLLVLLLLSFLFSGQLEHLLGMQIKYRKNQVSVETMASAKYRVSYLDVGQGNCTVIELGDGKVALIDAGNVMYGEKIYQFLKQRNISTIDFLFATHADADHIGGFNYLFSRMEIKNIYRPFQIAGNGETVETFQPIEAEDLKHVYDEYKTDSLNKISRVTSSVYQEFITNIYQETYTSNGNTYNSKVSVFYDGLKIVGSSYKFEFFAPLRRDETMSLLDYSNTYGYATMGFGAQNSNDNSAIFTFSSGENTYLFTGDASYKNSSGSTAGYCGELAFINSLTIEDKQALSKITVYLAGHHGSDNSSSADLFKVINPEFIVVSVAKDNEYGHPSMDMLERAKKSTNLKSDFLVCTDDYGTIVFSEFNGKLCYASYKIDERNERMISYELLASIIYVAIVVIIFCIRPRKKAETKIIDTAQK